MAGPPADVVVVGAGIAGAAAASHLARRRIGRVVGIEGRTPAAGATGRAAGIVSEQMWNRWDVRAVQRSKEEYAGLAARRAPGAYRTNGFLRWAASSRIASALEARTEELRAWGVDVRSVGASELERRLPPLRSTGVAAAAFAPSDAVVTPSDLTAAYLAEGREQGVDWRSIPPVDRLAREGGSWRWSERTGDRARIAVVAAGAWSKALLAASGAPLPLAPYRTQAAVLQPEPGAPDDLPSFHDLDTDVYGRPEEHGRLLAGDGTERVEADPDRFRPTGDPEFVSHLASCFGDRLPGWTDLRLVRAWAGVCVATPDRRPAVGAVPGVEGLYVLTGFNGFGVMRAGAAAAWLADEIVDGPRGEDGPLGPVSPARFAGPVRPFAPRPGFTLQAGPEPEF